MNKYLAELGSPTTEYGYMPGFGVGKKNGAVVVLDVPIGVVQPGTGAAGGAELTHPMYGVIALVW